MYIMVYTGCVQHVTGGQSECQENVYWLSQYIVTVIEVNIVSGESVSWFSQKYNVAVIQVHVVCDESV